MSAFGIVSYSAAGLAFTVFASLVCLSKRERSGLFLILATSGTAIWAVLLAYDAAQSAFPAKALISLELVRLSLWLLLLFDVIPAIQFGDIVSQ